MEGGSEDLEGERRERKMEGGSEDLEGERRERKMDGGSETTHNITDEVLAVVLDVSDDLVAHDIQDTLCG